MFIEKWFDVPIFYTDLNEDNLQKVQTEISNSFEEINKLDLSNPWKDGVKTSFKYDGFVDIIENMKWYNLRKNIIECVENYRLSVNYNINQNYNYGIQSWINISENGDFQFDHNHNSVGVSGVYYYKTNSEDGNIVFTHPNILISDNNFPFTKQSKNVYYVPKVGRLILFPSWLIHKVEINKTNNSRISIAFNVIFK
jgi:uncharacterized protein (TIGR02466 family)